MNSVQCRFLAQKLQQKMKNIEERNPNYEQSKNWQAYKKQEDLLYKKIEQLKRGEQENANQPNC